MHSEQVCERLGNGQFVGIAVTKTTHGNMHTGITYQWRGENYLYHQAFHIDTRLERFDAGVAELGGATLVVALPLRPERLKAVAGFLDHLGKINYQHPYTLKYDPKATIDRELGKLVSKDGKGLSCVTFVLAIFQTFKIRLIDASTWPQNRPEDLKAQQNLIEWLIKNNKATPEHIKDVREESGCLRVRPEEACGAGCHKLMPVKFMYAEPASLYLLKRISQLLHIPAWKTYPEAN